MQLRGALVSPAKTAEPTSSETLTRDQALVRLALSDYLTLTKPRIISLLLIITYVPMYLAAATPPDGMLILWTLIGGFLAAGGAEHHQPVRGP